MWQKYAKYKLVFISAWPGAPWCCVQLFVWCTFVEWCSLRMQSCSSLCEQASTRCLCRQLPLQLLCPCAESGLCLWGVCVPLPGSRWRCSWLATQVALAALNWFALKQRGSVHLFCIALGCEPQLGPVCCSCDLRMNFSLSFKFGVFEATYMLDVLIAQTQGLYFKFHEDIVIEWKDCWEVLNRLGRMEGVTLSAFLPILVFGNSFWSEAFPELYLVFVFRESVWSSAGGCSQVFHV